MTRPAGEPAQPAFKKPQSAEPKWCSASQVGVFTGIPSNPGPDGCNLGRRTRGEHAFVKNSSIRMLWMASGVGLLTISSLVQVGEPPAPRTPGEGEAKALSKDVPSCTATSLSSSVGGAAWQVNENRHSVTLSWNASVANSTSKLEAIQGYSVYRSLASRTYTENNRINSSPLPGTACVDSDVQPGETYFYAVRAVTVSGVKSDFSKEAKAKIPSP